MYPTSIRRGPCSLTKWLSFRNRRRCIGNCATDDPAGLFEGGESVVAADAELLHYDRGLHALVGRCEQLARFFPRNAGDLDDDSLTSVLQLVVGGAQIHHQVSVR